MLKNVVLIIPELLPDVKRELYGGNKSPLIQIIAIPQI